MQHAERLAGRCRQVDQVPQPPHVLKLQMQRVIKIDMGLRDAVRQQHPRARPVEVADELDRATRARPVGVWPRPVPLMTRHNDSVHRRGPAGHPPRAGNPRPGAGRRRDAGHLP